MFNELNDQIKQLEQRMLEYSEMTSLGRIKDLYNWKVSDFEKTPEYNHQRYTFKYGNYDMFDLMQSYQSPSLT